MRPLKPFALALGGLIAAVFGAVFFGAPTGTASAAPTKGQHPDLQSKSLPASAGLVASRDAKPAAKSPQPHLPSYDFLSDDSLRLTRAGYAELLPVAYQRIVDRRALLLVGVVELRI